MTRPVPNYKARCEELLHTARQLICEAKAANPRDQEEWFEATNRWLTNFDIHIGSTED